MKYYYKIYIIQAPNERPASAGFFICAPQMRFLSSSISRKNRNPFVNLITSYHETLYLHLICIRNF